MQWHVGTSGWGYDAWNGIFYPEDLPDRERIGFYAQYFDAVEINTSFYHLPRPQTLVKWETAVSPHFLFAVKGSRYITHRKKLTDPEEPVSVLMDILKVQKKGGPVIFQLPPHWKVNAERLKHFIAVLPKARRYAIEFRDPSWHTEEIYALLRRYNIAFCLFEKADMRSPRLVTADFIYVRLHGRKEGYKGNYTKPVLSAWRRWLSDQGRDVYIFFDNTDEKLYAIENALDFHAMVKRPTRSRDKKNIPSYV